MSSRNSRVRALFVAAMLLPALVWADARVEARRHFKTGMALIADGKLDDGISELLEAYGIRPHPNVLFNIARAYEAGGRPAEALVFYNRYLDANPPDAEKVREIALKLEAQAPKKVTPIAPAEEPREVKRAPQVDEATVKRLDALAERLERAVEKAEARVETPAPAENKPVAADDFGVPYEETVVAASRRAQATLDAPNAITVITGDEIRASGLVSLADILRRVPGAEVMTMGLASANVSFRGFNQRIANKVLLLIDGRPEYQDFLGVTLWGVLPVGLEEIERVEVIRGPGSALYGANAMLGVVNVITRAPGSGPNAEFNAMAGNANLAGGSFVASGGDKVRFRASVGYQQGDKYTRDYANDRPDLISTSDDPNLGLRSARGNLTAFYAFNKDYSIALSAGVNRLYTELYALGLLRNYTLDGLGGYAKFDFTGGPVKFRFFWNHSNFDAKPQYEPIGQRSLATSVDTNVFDGEALFQKEFSLAGTHVVAIGLSARLKRVSWGYIGPLTQEVHAAAFVQDEWRIIKPLTLSASYRIDRHPLLDKGKPGYAQSPRVSLVVRPFESHAFRASFATAFRQPTFLESYMDIRTPVPGVTGASVLTSGNRELRPERLISFEVGYRGELPQLGITVDLAGYWNIVNDLIVLSAVNPVNPADAFDEPSQSFLLGRSLFTNDAQEYTARGAELGVTWNATKGLDVRASAAFQSVVANGRVSVCGPCTQAPAVKVNAGFIYRTPVNLDLSADLSFVTSTIWVEREPSPQDPTQITNPQNPLAAYTVINARVGYRLFNDKVTVAVVGSQLGPSHQEHPFGNNVNRRVFAQLTVQP
ncbi:MAG: TonB-dependent receptor [Archangium sp.]|nr:TonB-dependent receptor [Archangium sp.]MDP3154093.1 TonB-dependent receptor [Archangium sp.]MDP3570003.1 TonB-dependent receptor [Archangium sp.]